MADLRETMRETNAAVRRCPASSLAFQRCGPAIASGLLSAILAAGAGHALEWRPLKVEPSIETLGKETVNFADGARKWV